MSVTYRLTAATPTSVGWYDPRSVNKQVYIRPSSLKGVWRWWTRAIVGGLLYEADLLTCDKGGNCKAKIPTTKGHEVLDISTILGRLGLGAGGEHSEVSRYQILITMKKKPDDCNKGTSQQSRGGPSRPYTDLQRVKLLTLGGRNVEFFAGGEFYLTLRKTLVQPRQVEAQQYQLDLDTAKKTLLISLTLGGVGKGSRRGLGSLDVMPEREESYDLRQLLERVREEIARRLKISPGGIPSREIPPVTLISKQNTEIYKITCGGSPPQEPCRVSRALEIVHNFFVRTRRQNALRGDPLREELIAWVLGLPRQQRGTGYFTNVDRRASPFILSYHSNHVVDGRHERLYLTVIKSADWPQKITWRNSTTRDITVTEADIIQAVNTAVETLREYLNIGGCRMTKIWP